MPGLYAAASISVYITPPGGSSTDYSQYLAYAGSYGQLSVTQNFGRQGDTATIPLVDDWQGRTTPHFVIYVESQIVLYDNVLGEVLFAGVVTAPGLVPDGPNRSEWILTCTDYTYYADNAIIHGTYNGLAIDQIVLAVTAQANCGITAATVAGGGYVAPAPVLTQVNLNYQTLSQAWRTLAQLASSSTPYGWYVDQSRALHFFDSSTALSSGVGFTTTPTAAGGGSFTEGHIVLGGSATYTWDGTSIRNRILVQGANQVFRANLNGNATDRWRGNGVQTSWPLRYTVTGSPSLYVNGVSTSVTVLSGGTTASTPGTWYVEQNAWGQWFLTNSRAPGDGWVIELWYDYQVPVIAQANDKASQAQYTGPNGGVFTMYINDTTLSTTSMALARAMRERTEYAFAAERIVFTTGQEFFGWVRAGETFTLTSTLLPDSLNSYVWGLNGATFLCIANTVSFGSGGYRTMSITGVRI